MKLHIRATKQELESNREKALHKLSEGKFKIIPHVHEEPSPLKALRQLEDESTSAGHKLFGKLLVEVLHALRT